ncbi:hypothetical protein QBC43DRAFT_362692 [Cladorrhinum sp. PSN259]|nr:hypothetical protein QBC43DRAFT_362692 [Cladorrhinum sp. PSN259]
MATAALNVLGVISGVLGIIQFGIDNFAPPDAVGSTVKILVGLDVAGGLQNAGGDLPDVRLFNEAGAFLGITADPGDIKDGTTAEIKINHNDDSGQQAAYALFSANNNAICIASASITWPNGDEYGWVGDWGAACGGSWYFSNVFIQGSNHKPNCLWIDGNGDQPQTGFQIHWPEFVQKSDQPPGQTDIEYYCHSGPPFKMYTDRNPKSITYWVLGSGKKKRQAATADEPTRSRLHERRQNQNRQVGNSTVISLAERLGELLVFSDGPEHSAIELCSSKTSLGPDFANNDEGLFCRMSDKTLWPFCNQMHVDYCFDANIQRLVIGGKATRDKKYANVMNWGGSGKGAAGTA